MSRFCMVIGLCVALVCLLTVRGLNSGETGGHRRGQIKTQENVNVKTEQVRLNRRSTRQFNDRTRREVRTLVSALQTNADKLENLTAGMEFLMQSEREKQTKNEDIIQRLESFNSLFVSVFVVLADTAFSTSPRIANNQTKLIEMSNLFRDNIKTPADIDMFEKKLSSVYDWYVRSFPSCTDIRNSGIKQSGKYTVKIPRTNTSLKVFCDQETDGGGWLVIQRRQDGSVDFFRNWTDYQAGFGDISGEFWIGNDNLHLLTNVSQELRVDIMDFEGNTAFAKYSTFVVGPSSENYKLTISGYSGTAGDAMDYHNGMQFSTMDRDNDKHSGSCVAERKCGWWFNSCDYSNLNGVYVNFAEVHMKTANWNKWKSKDEALKRIEMKIRPLN